MKKKFQEGSGELSIANVKGDTDEQLTSKESFKRFIEAYKLQNPEKYELKKALLEEQLKKL